MNIKKILIIGVLASTFAACSSNSPPITQEVEEVVNVDVVSYYNSIWFDHNSTKVSSDFSAILKLNADYLNANPSALIQVQGNASEIGGKKHDYALGVERAHAVAKALEKLGVNPKQILEVSFGSSNEALKNKHSSQNSRVDIVYTSGAPLSYRIDQLPIVSTEDESVEFEPISIKDQQSKSSHASSSAPSSIVPPPTIQVNNVSGGASSSEAAAESIMNVTQ